MKKLLALLALSIVAVDCVANDWIQPFIDADSVEGFYKSLDENGFHKVLDPGGLQFFKVPKLFEISYSNDGLSFERFLNIPLLRELDAFDQIDVAKYTSSIVITYNDSVAKAADTSFKVRKYCDGNTIEISPFKLIDLSSVAIRRSSGGQSSYIFFLNVSLEEVRYMLEFNDPCYLELFDEAFG